jgi:histidinol phosphatase-like PHP family hydrolase
MSDESYNGSVFVSRRLTEAEVRELRITLLPYFHVSGGLGAEDIADFLDYTFAMVSNAKTVDYVLQELIGMEMDFCNEQVAKKVGKELAAFIIKITSTSTTGGGEEGEETSNPQDDEEDVDDTSKGAVSNKGPRVKSLKVIDLNRIELN